MTLMKLLWVEGADTVHEWEFDGRDSYIGEGRIRLSDGYFDGPGGTYHLIDDEKCWTMRSEDPVPVFLHESFVSSLERWVMPLLDAADEVRTIAQVRDRVSALVDSRIANNPQCLSVSPTVTTTEPTSSGMAVVGRAVVIQPRVAA